MKESGVPVKASRTAEDDGGYYCDRINREVYESESSADRAD
jgi:hypothetical protein